jgi:hypothetical protein
MIRNGMIIDATEPAPFGIPDDLVVSRRIAPAHQAAHHARAERHLDGRGRPPIPSRLWSREQQVVGDPQHQLGIVEQAIHLDQFRVQIQLERNPCEKPFVPRICYNQHRASCIFE